MRALLRVIPEFRKMSSLSSLTDGPNRGPVRNCLPARVLGRGTLLAIKTA